MAQGTIEIRAAVCRAFGAPLAIETLRLAPPQGSEIRVRVRASSICHSDITYMDGGWGGELPTVFGHELAGVVTDLGPAVPPGSVARGEASEQRARDHARGHAPLDGLDGRPPPLA